MIERVIPLHTLARLFLRLGLTAFGGPAAHIAMLHHEVVRRRMWMSDEEFAELIAITNVIPETRARWTARDFEPVIGGPYARVQSSPRPDHRPRAGSCFGARMAYACDGEVKAL
jgi:hypothetical protein